MKNARKRVLVALTALAVLTALTAQAQDLDPRNYSNTPVGLNFLSATVTQLHSTGYRLTSEVLGYTHIFDIGGQSAKLSLLMPYAELSAGASPVRPPAPPVTASLDGMADPLLRLSVNLFGAPALSVEEFRNYRQDLIVGASLAVSVPWGDYDSRRLMNIGANRWYFRPGLGVSKAFGPLRVELDGTATIFEENSSFMGTRTLSQRPIYSMAGHIVYSFQNGAWAALDAVYYSGGERSIDGQWQHDGTQSWRAGVVAVLPIDTHNSIKLYGSDGVLKRTGNDYSIWGAVWQYRWGPGL